MADHPISPVCLVFSRVVFGCVLDRAVAPGPGGAPGPKPVHHTSLRRTGSHSARARTARRNGHGNMRPAQPHGPGCQQPGPSGKARAPIGRRGRPDHFTVDWSSHRIRMRTVPSGYQSGKEGEAGPFRVPATSWPSAEHARAIMEFRVLGPIELWSAGQQCDLGAARARSILAILLLAPGTIVPAEVLIERVWDTQPPPKARESLSVYITRLRASLRQAIGESARLTGRARGYELDVDPGDDRPAPVPAAAPTGGRTGGQRRRRSRGRPAARGGRALARPGVRGNPRRLDGADAGQPATRNAGRPS